MPRHLPNLKLPAIYVAGASLVALTVGLQAWLVLRAVVPAADSVRYVSVAQALDPYSTEELLRTSADAPFAIIVRGVHRARQLLGGEYVTWAGSVQLAATVPLVLLPLPLMLLYRRWLPTFGAWLATAMMLLFPAVARSGAAGLPDGWHLLLCVIAL